jgi:hypothetical protein
MVYSASSGGTSQDAATGEALWLARRADRVTNP